MTDALTELANRHGSDKGDQHRNRHGYTRIYAQYLAELRDTPLTLLELGLCHPEDASWQPLDEGEGATAAPHQGGWRGHKTPSLAIWSDWFRAGRIIGFDINDFSQAALPPRCQVVQGDASSPTDLAALAALGPFDIIIDDASHASVHQQTALAALWPSLAAGGLYFIEDLHWQPRDLERDDVPTTRSLLRRLQVEGVLESPLLAPDLCAGLVGELKDVALFDSLEPPGLHNSDPADLSDAISVLIKKRVQPIGVP